ncbi:MAG: hypothetical protein AYK23_02610 [Candidatus Proteinoplasmatales archaeon SG8-5]|nr:MAG: hypothetical protein AYK23_02610 [Candidatus Proteinoplasmatales archaeon SG8-5]
MTENGPVPPAAAGLQTTTDQSTTDQSTTDQSTTDQSSTHQPTTDQSTTHQPTTVHKTSVDGISELWEDQRTKTFDFDFDMYNSKPWMLAKIVLCISIITLTYVLYALHELPWTIFGFGIGLLIYGVAPFFAGLILGFGFDDMKKALAVGIVIGLISMFLALAIFVAPYSMGLADYTGEFMLEAWFYFFISIINMISFVPAGVAVGTASNMYE